ncbi:MAG: hypothetical protein MJ252_14705, partial [archaeon]|nr:hypothetical protein [archaeon]
MLEDNSELASLNKNNLSKIENTGEEFFSPSSPQSPQSPRSNEIQSESIDNEIEKKNLRSSGESSGLKFIKEINDKLVNEGIGNTNTEWIKTENTKIVLMKILDNVYFEGHLYLNNLTYCHLVIKIKCDKKEYTITPTLTFIKPKSNRIINIKKFLRFQSSEENNNSNGNYLEVYAYKSENEINEYEDINLDKCFFEREKNLTDQYQLLKIPIEEDNGNDPIIFKKYLDGRKNIMAEMSYFFDMNLCTDKDDIIEQINIVT